MADHPLTVAELPLTLIMVGGGIVFLAGWRRIRQLLRGIPLDAPPDWQDYALHLGAPAVVVVLGVFLLLVFALRS